jgi:hypothetical protein
MERHDGFLLFFCIPKLFCVEWSFVLSLFLTEGLEV